MTAAPSPAEIIARAEKRLTPLIVRHGSGHPLVLAAAERYGALYAQAVARTTPADPFADVAEMLGGAR
jgi:hypothetical protein